MVTDRQVLSPRADMVTPVAAEPDTGTIYADGAMDRFTGAHESAHLLEKLMTGADRKRFAKVMGMPNRPWEVGKSGATGQESTGYRGSLSEIMADWTAMLATRHDPSGNKVISGFVDTDAMPSRKQLLRFGRSLERFGARNSLPQYVRPSRG